MKKKVVIFIIILIVLILLIPKEESDEFRIRVIANSDSDYDQALKMEVVEVIKDEITKYESNGINKVKKEIMSHQKEIKAQVSKVLKNKEFTLEIKKVQFPPKELENKVIPGGSYETLLVVIEDGKGKNWWSVLYPEYHNISFEDIETGEVVFEFYFFEELKKLLSN